MKTTFFQKIGLIILFICILFPFSVKGEEQWAERKGEHFIVLYPPSTGSSWAGDVLRHAENYYDRIAREIGYARHHQFWTWEERVKIYVYNSAEDFARETDLPSWAKAAAFRDYTAFSSRAIVTFMQEDDFLESLLPHEVSHLILRDFIGPNKDIPVWFDEGVAQLQEEKKRRRVKRSMKKIVRSGRQIPFQEFSQTNIRDEKDTSRVSLFYAQSLSVVDFMIRKYGSYKFGQLCRFLKDGKSLGEALPAAYPYGISSLKDLEKNWLRYMKN